MISDIVSALVKFADESSFRNSAADFHSYFSTRHSSLPAFTCKSGERKSYHFFRPQLRRWGPVAPISRCRLRRYFSRRQRHHASPFSPGSLLTTISATMQTILGAALHHRPRRASARRHIARLEATIGRQSPGVRDTLENAELTSSSQTDKKVISSASTSRSGFAR